MSELKAISGHEIREDIDYNTRGVDTEDKEWRNYGKELCSVLYYRKSEADKVIAELKSQKAQVEDDCAYWKMREGNAANAMHETEEYSMQLYNELRHSKYKRCLEMARIAKDDWHLHNSFYAMGHQEFEKRKCEFYEKWRQRWLELAKKFKETK